MNRRIFFSAACAIFLGAFVSTAAFCGYARGNYVGTELPLPEGAVKAMVVRDPSELIGGPKAEGRVGDFKIYNNKVGFVICGARPSSGYSPLGGMVEDAGRLKREEDGYYWWNIMGDVFQVFFRGQDALMSSRLFAPVRAEVLKDGSDGEAIVRVVGRDAEFPIRKEFINRESKSLKIEITIDYVLRPDSKSLEVRTTIRSERKKRAVFSIGLVYMLGDGINILFPEYGYDWNKVRGTVAPSLSAKGSGMSYGWYPPDIGIRIIEKISSLTITTTGMVKVPAGKTGTHTYYLIVGDGDIASFYEEKYRLEGRTNTGIVEGKCVTKGTGEPATDAEVYLLSPVGNYRYQAMVRPDGTFRVVAQPEEYQVKAISYERDDSEPVSVKVETGKTKEVLIEIEPPAELKYEIVDDSGEFIPAMISFKKLEGKPTLFDGSKFNMGKYGGGYYKNYFSKDGKGTVEVRPGKYEVYFTRGVEYEYEMKTMEFTGGETAEAKAVLKHVVDTTGFLSADSHVHSRPSPDSDDSVYDKVLGSAALGLEVPIATDHDRHNDYKPYIKKLGLGRYVTSIVGNELTTIRLGHFNGFPMTYDPSRRNEGAIEWYGLTGPEIFQAFDDDPGELEVVQLNHPRVLGGGYLDFVGYDPKTGTANDEVNFSWNFDAIEILNGTGYNDLKKTTLDWYSFLNLGERKIGVGVSDNHKVYRLGLGYPRSYVGSSTDIAGEMDENEFIRAMLDQKVTVSGGAFITANINGEAGLGEVVTDTDGTADLNIKVQAPSWVKVETLTVVGNGEELQTIELSNDSAPVRYEDTVKVNLEKDTWYVVRVEGSEKLFPVYPGAKPYSFTNPIYVDVDGNGQFDPPMKFEE